MFEMTQKSGVTRTYDQDFICTLKKAVVAALTRAGSANSIQLAAMLGNISLFVSPVKIRDVLSVCKKKNTYLCSFV